MKIQLKVIKTDNAVGHTNRLNNFLDSISGYGYELKEVDNRVTDSGFTTFVTYYQKFESDPYDELHKRMKEASGHLM